MGLRRGARTEVDRRKAGRGELGDRRPRLLGRDVQRAGVDQLARQWVVDGDRPGARVARDRQLPEPARQLVQARLGLIGRAARRVAEVDVSGAGVR